MEVAVIRNKKQMQELICRLNERRLPYRIAIQDIFPTRSLDVNSYYWGVVLKHISDATGHTQEECHKGFKRKHLIRYDMRYNPDTKRYEWKTEEGSTTELNNREVWDYVLKVRVEAEIDMGITIPLPNEVFISELIFEAEL